MASGSAASVTIDRHYFETLLRRANHGGANDAPDSARAVTSPSELAQLRSIAKKYENLVRNLVRGGVEDATIALLSKDDSEIQTGKETNGGRPIPSESGRVTPTTYRSPHVAASGVSSVTAGTYTNNGYPHRGGGGQLNGLHRGTDQGTWADDEPESEYVDIDGETTTDGPVGANYPTPRPDRGPQFDKQCTRTVLLSNLPEGTTHADVTDAIRGGILLDIFLRSHDRCVAVSFLHSADARAFFDHVRKHDLYIKNKRVTIKWNERQFTLAGHAVGKISGGATRNFIIKGIDPFRHTEESIREDLEHIHNLVVVKIEFKDNNCHIKTNSVNYALFARTCMMSRGKYKGTRIEWDVDECAQPYDPILLAKPQATNLQPSQRREAPPSRKVSNMSNRFQLLNLEEDEEDEVAATFQSKKSVGVTA